MTLLKLDHQLVIHERLHIWSAADLSLLNFVAQRSHVINRLFVVLLHLPHVLLDIVSQPLKLQLLFCLLQLNLYIEVLLDLLGLSFEPSSRLSQHHPIQHFQHRYHLQHIVFKPYRLGDMISIQIELCQHVHLVQGVQTVISFYLVECGAQEG